MQTTKPRDLLRVSGLRAFVFILGSAPIACGPSNPVEQSAELVVDARLGQWELDFRLPPGASDVRFRVGEGLYDPLELNPVTVEMVAEPTTIDVTWLDTGGHAHTSSFAVDPLTVQTDSSKRWLERTPTTWAKLGAVDGHPHLMLTGVMADYCGVSKVSYGVDTMQPDREVTVSACDIKQPSRKYELLWLPDGTEFVSVQITYFDGTTSKVERLDID